MARWQTAKIGDICTVERGGSPRPIDKYITDSDDGINWIKIGDTTDSMYITKTAQKIIPEGMKKSRYVKPGDFLLSNSMSFGRPYILKIDGCIHDGWLVLRDNQNLFDKRFLYYFLSAPITYQKFQSLAVGGVVNNLNSEMVRGVEVPIPSMEDQRQIADTLGRIGELITLRKQQLAKLDELVKARFVEMFGNISETISLSHYIVALSAGKSLAGEAECPNKVLKTGAATYDFFEPTQVKNLPIDYTPLAEHQVKSGDIIISRMNTAELVGATAYVWVAPPNTFLPDRLWRAELQEQTNPIFLWQLLIQPTVKESIRSIASGTSGSMKNISKSGLLGINVKRVPYELQNQFASFVSYTHNLSLTVQQGLDKLEMVKKALMQQYFG